MKHSFWVTVACLLALFGCSSTSRNNVVGLEAGGSAGVENETSESSTSSGGSGSEESTTTDSTTTGGSGGSFSDVTSVGGSSTTGSISDGGTAGTSDETSSTGGTGGTGINPMPICTPGETLCSDTTLQTCADDGLSWENTPCDFVCVNDAACDGVCVPGTTQCTGESVETCTADGQWLETQTCAFVCQAGQCEGECSPGVGKCDGNTTQICDEEGSWVDGDSCDFVCSAGACTGACTPGTTQCNGNTNQTCNNGGTWDDTQVCSFVCSGNGSCTGECMPGASRCEGLTPETCSAAGQWVTGSECPFVCSSGSCTGSCTPGAKRCSGTGVQTCNSNGQWGSAKACPGDVNANPICTGQGICGTSCKAGFDDCTSAPGCESDLNKPATCGSCGNSCPSNHGTATCNGGSCGINCNAGYANCTSASGCETALGTETNCESCGDTCNENPDNASPVCTNQGCSFVCDSSWGNCDGQASNGCEQDLNNDPDNCGGCGISCYGGTCSNGTCSVPDIQAVSEWSVASGQNIYGSVTSLAVDSNAAYAHTDKGYILKLAKDGTGSPIELASSQTIVSQNNLLVEDGFVYWVSTQGLYKVSINGGVPVRLTTQTPLRFDVEDGMVYWNTGVLKLADHCKASCTTRFYRVSTNGGTPLWYDKDGDFHAQVRANGVSLYATKFSYNAAYNTYMISMYQYEALTGDAIQTITGSVAASEPTHNFSAFTYNGTYLFYRTRVDDDISGGSSGARRLGRVPLAGTQLYTQNVEISTDPTVNSDTQLDDLDADESYVYYNSTELRRVSVNGGAYETLTPPSHIVNTLALDSNYVYWTTLLGNTSYVFRAPK